MMTITIISFLLAVALPAAAMRRAGKVPDSISALVYSLPKKWQWVWMVWMLAVSFTTCMPMIDALEAKGAGWLGYVVLACLAFVSVMPLTQEKEMHYPLAIMAGIVSQVCVMVVCPWWLLLWIIMVVLVMVAFAGFNDSEEVPVILDGKGVMVAEGICYVSMIGSVMTCLI